jgi:hypothetical protein
MPCRDPWPYFCSFQTFTCFQMVRLLEEKSGLTTAGHSPPSSPCTGEWLLALALSLSLSATSHSQSARTKSKLYYDRRSLCQPVLVSCPHLGTKTRLLLLSDSCGRTRGRACRLQLLLVLASVVILGSESSGTHEHILLS